ncbi:MAG: membrane protein insertase YidC, partial [Treponema sp.]|nr:membrane protein insertase YidC [Treponema sp.]
MDKRTILAIVLSVAVMIAFFAIQSIFFPPSVPSPASTQQTGSQEQVSQGVAAPQPASDSLSLGEIASPETPVEKSPVEEAPAEIIPLENVTIETDIIKVVLSNAGGNVISFQLKNHNDGNMPVEMIFSGSSTPGAFAVAFGNLNDVITERIRPVNLNFKVNRISNYIVEFSQVFSASSGSNFTMTKRYE